ncbi:MAG: Gfo/Idh/MocA family oxidoreductase [Proteobacteria bacterium]|nr:Gfo/Idh/MocA family oxidoreductase [Pseudomonadota bacterium]
MADQDLGLGVVGAGYWGKNLVRNFANRKGARLVAVADLHERNRARAAAFAPDATITDDYAKLLDDQSIGAIAVCTEAASHHKLAKAALLADKHVYVEKPLALEEAHAEELVRLAKERDRILMVGHLMIYHPGIRWIKGQITAGEIGDIYYLYCQRLNLGIVRKDESAWWSLAPHDVSIILYLLGAAPRNVSARGNSYIRPGNEDVVFANLQFAGGQTAEIHTSWLDPHKIRNMTLVGSRKMVTFDDTVPTEKIRIYDKGADRQVDYDSYADLIALRQGDIWIPSLKMSEPLAIECQHFVDCVREHREPDTPGQQGLDVVRILCAGQKSMAQDGAPIALGADG